MTVSPDNVTALRPQQPTPQGGALAMWSREQIEVVKELICPGASDTELELFGQVCQQTGLNPFARQIYGFMRSVREGRGDDARWVKKLSIQTSIDGFRLTAQRSGEYAGQVGPQWCGPDGRWRDVWLVTKPPAAARVGVLRTGWAQPTYAVATWAEYCQKDTKGNPTSMWANMPANQLAKCAEALALRKVFPAELSGLYSTDEMAQADNEPQPVTSTSAPAHGTGAALEGEVLAPTPTAGWTGALRTKWATACQAYTTVGLTVPPVPPADAKRAIIVGALQAMGVAYEARKTACESFRALTAEAVRAGVDIDVIDPATLTPEDLAGTHQALVEMLAAAEAAGAPEAPSDDTAGAEPAWLN